jgi:glyoxylase-like metal-dependent hydrolase (beta-lactamase superfamily II)
MTVTALREGLYLIPDLVNEYLLDRPAGLVLIDTGFPRSTAKILQAIAARGFAAYSADACHGPPLMIDADRRFRERWL